MTAGRILDNGEAHVSQMDSLDYSGLIKTYNVDQQTPDSAGTATAYLCGVKGRAGTLGVNAAVARRDCSNVNENRVESVLEKAKKAGSSIGFRYKNHSLIIIKYIHYQLNRKISWNRHYNLHATCFSGRCLL